MAHEMTIGRQPCQNFQGMLDGNEHATWENRHECFQFCGKTVSFCEGCHYDHHSGGYETCVRKDNPE